MKERPILFTGAMVRALLAGTKTQTRRPLYVLTKYADKACFDRRYRLPPQMPPLGKMWTLSQWRKAQPGDVLWARENFRGCRAYEVQGYAPKDWGNKPIWFEADGTPPGKPEAWATKVRPSIHMPRWACRITREVVSVRVERLQDISEADALAEGVVGRYHGLSRGHARAYSVLWEQINGPGSWDANPWVVAIEFKPLEKP